MNKYIITGTHITTNKPFKAEIQAKSKEIIINTVDLSAIKDLNIKEEKAVEWYVIYSTHQIIRK